MPNRKGGRNYRKKKKGSNEPVKQEFFMADLKKGQFYGKIIKRFNCKRFNVAFSEEIELKGKKYTELQATSRKSNGWKHGGHPRLDDIVIVGISPCDTKPTGNIIWKYSQEHVRELIRRGEIDDSFVNKTEDEDAGVKVVEGAMFEFAEEEIDIDNI